jgi:DNA-binding LytR/AlgR family response regulator
MENEIVSLPTVKGLQFVKRANIVLFICKKKTPTEKSKWKVRLINGQKILLKPGISAKAILGFMEGRDFIQINQSAIVRVNYVSSIGFNTKECFLLPPFQEKILPISKIYLAKIKDEWARL